MVFRQQARKIVDDLVIKRWALEIETDGPSWVKCTELLVAYAYGKPKEHIELSQDPDAPVNHRTALTLEELQAIARSQLEKEKSK